MRLENFASVDPAIAGRSGLRRGGARCRRIFDQWADDRDGLRKTAALLRDDMETKIPGLFDSMGVDLPAAFQGRFELYEHLGFGGFAWVFQCINRKNGDLRAIKILKPECIRDKEAFGRFRREIRILKEIRHPNVIQIYDDNLDEERDRPAFLMDLAECSLVDYMEEVRDAAAESSVPDRPYLGHAEAVGIMRNIFDAVEAIHTHEHRLVHRDINPQNILRYPDGRWALGDFGLAKFLKKPPAVSTATYVTSNRIDGGWGKEPYTAPEQWRRFGDVDERADVYSLGVLLWELFTDQYPPIRESVPGLPPSLAPVFLKAHQHDKAMRYGTISEFRSDFEAAASSLGDA
jgi:serine/threonine protein kinase